jgi:uncharacterized protein DUF262
VWEETVVAKAGDIKEALPHSLDSIFREHYAIPEFQRPYVWKKKSILELFDDLHDAQLERARDDYFIGSLVVFRGRDGRLNLVDGQQRIITLTLLNCAFRDRILEVDPAANTTFFDGLVRGARRTARGGSKEEDRIHAQTYPDREILADIIEGKGADLNAWNYPGGQRWLVYAYWLLLAVASTIDDWKGPPVLFPQTLPDPVKLYSSLAVKPCHPSVGADMSRISRTSTLGGAPVHP